MFTLRFERVDKEGRLQSVVLSAPTYVVDAFGEEYIIGVYASHVLTNGVEYRVRDTDGFTHFTASNAEGKVVEQLVAQQPVATPKDQEEEDERKEEVAQNE